MDGKRFDRMTRRFVLGAFTGVSISPVAALVQTAAKKRQKLKRNAFGCVNAGKKCRGKNSVCCSGICKGKKPKKGERDESRCVAHGADICQAGQNLPGCGGPQHVACTTSTGDPGACRTTTGKAGYCYGDSRCWPCAKDADCRPYCGADAACVVCTSVLCPEGTQCVGPTDDGCSFPPA